MQRDLYSCFVPRVSIFVFDYFRFFFYRNSWYKTHTQALPTESIDDIRLACGDWLPLKGPRSGGNSGGGNSGGSGGGAGSNDGQQGNHGAAVVEKLRTVLDEEHVRKVRKCTSHHSARVECERRERRRQTGSLVLIVNLIHKAHCCLMPSP